MKYYIYIMLVTFKLTLKQLYKNSLIFAMAGLARNFLLFIIFGLFYGLAALLIISFTPVGIAVTVLMYVFLFPAFRMLLIQYTVFPLIKKHMIDPYYKDHPDEDKEAKHALNIMDDIDENEEDRVFEDTLPSEDDEPRTNFPRQYSDEEMRRLKRKEKRARRDNNDDDDGTI